MKLEDKKLVIRKTDEGWPAAAVWNFPNAVKGRLTLKLKPEPNFESATILLTDHYSVPFDLEDRFYALYQLKLRESSDFPPGRTSELSFDWDLKTRDCRVTLNRRRLATLPLERSSEGVNYLRLRAEQGGFAVQSVEATADQKP